MAAPSFEEFQQQDSGVPSFDAFQRQESAPAASSIPAAAWAGMKAGILPSLAQFAERKALGMAPEAAPAAPDVGLAQQAKDTARAIGSAFRNRPGQTAAYLAGNALVDAPLLAAMNLIPGAGEAADVGWLAKIAKALAPAAKGATAAGAQSAAQQLGEKGAISPEELKRQAVAGAVIPAAATALGAPFKAAAGAQLPRSPERAEAVERAKQLGLDPSPAEAAGKKSTSAAAAVAEKLSPIGEKIAAKRDVRNGQKINAIVNKEAGLPEDVRPTPEAITKNLNAKKQSYANLVGEERVVADPEFASDLRNLAQQSSKLDINDRNFIERLQVLTQPPPGTRAFIPGDRYIRLRTELRDARTSALARGDRYAANFYRDAQSALDSAFDRTLQAAGKNKRLSEIKTLRSELRTNYDLRDLAQSGGIRDGFYDPQKLFKMMNDDPNVQVSTKLWADRSPLEKAVSVANELGIEHPVPEVSLGERSVWPNKAWLLHALSSVSPTTTGAALTGAAGLYGGVPGAAATMAALGVLPYAWEAAPGIAKAAAKLGPLAPAAGAATQAYNTMPSE